jgi:hypothetical protein
MRMAPLDENLFLEYIEPAEPVAKEGATPSWGDS